MELAGQGLVAWLLGRRLRLLVDLVGRLLQQLLQGGLLGPHVILRIGGEGQGQGGHAQQGGDRPPPALGGQRCCLLGAGAAGQLLGPGPNPLPERGIEIGELEGGPERVGRGQTPVGGPGHHRER